MRELCARTHHLTILPAASSTPSQFKAFSNARPRAFPFRPAPVCLIHAHVPFVASTLARMHIALMQRAGTLPVCSRKCPCSFNTPPPHPPKATPPLHQVRFHTVYAVCANANTFALADELALAILVFGSAAFISGFALTTQVGDSTDGRVYPLKMNYPTAARWHWRHQLLLSLCISCLSASHALVQHANAGDKYYIASINVSVSDPATNGVFAAWLLAICASGFLNALLVPGDVITLRAGNMQGTIHDICLVMGFTLRSRSLRFFWRVRLQLCAYLAFYLGGIIGSLVFRSSFGASAVIFPAILLLPLWLLGSVLCATRYSNPAVYRTQASDLASTYVDAVLGGIAQLDARSSVVDFAPPEIITRASFVQSVQNNVQLVGKALNFRA